MLIPKIYVEVDIVTVVGNTSTDTISNIKAATTKTTLQLLYYITLGTSVTSV